LALIPLLYQHKFIKNERVDSFFTADRGLRQGDAISPLLFLLVMKVFMRMLCFATAIGLLFGFSINQMNTTTIKVSHLLFVDETIIFSGNDCEQMVNLWCILVCFEARQWVWLIISNFFQVCWVAQLNLFLLPIWGRLWSKIQRKAHMGTSTRKVQKMTFREKGKILC